MGKDRETHQRDLFESIERGDFPRWTLFIQVMTDERGEGLPVQSVRSHEGLAEGGLSADRSRLFRAEPQSRELLRGDRAGCVLAGQHRSRHRLLAGQDAARRACSPTATRSATGSASTSITSRSTRRSARSTATIVTARCAPTEISGARRPTSRTVTANGPTSPTSTSRRLRSTVQQHGGGARSRPSSESRTRLRSCARRGRAGRRASRR